MAKKVIKPTESYTSAATTSKTAFGFSKIADMIQDISKKTAITIENNSKERTYISTGIYILDALLAKSIIKGGVSRNRITIFAGDPQTGKSYILYGICRNAQKEGYNVIYIDTEYSVELNDLETHGVDIGKDRFMLIRSNKVEDLKITLTQLLNKLKEEKLKGTDIGKTIICLDSIGQLASRKEVDDALDGKEKADMTKAKAIKSLFRIINSDLGYLDIPLICTNHIYMCLTEDAEVLKSDGTYDFINNINIGDFVQTLDGKKEVLEKFEYNDSDIIQLTFENGETIKCTPNHRFLVKSEWNEDENNECWKTADELVETDEILALDELWIKFMLEKQKFIDLKNNKTNYITNIDTEVKINSDVYL